MENIKSGKIERVLGIYTKLMKFSNSEVIVLWKILLDSRAFTKAQMTGMLDKLISCCV